MPASIETDVASAVNDQGEESSGGATAGQKNWLRRGLEQPGGKLPLFDDFGQKISERTVRSCLEKGWAEPWFNNPLKPNWIVCKLTEAGRKAAAD